VTSTNLLVDRLLTGEATRLILLFQPVLKILPFLRDLLRSRNVETVPGDAEAGIGLRFATDRACSLSNPMRLLATQESE
jgi:hypothetical protein